MQSSVPLKPGGPWAWAGNALPGSPFPQLQGEGVILVKLPVVQPGLCLVMGI